MFIKDLPQKTKVNISVTKIHKQIIHMLNIEEHKILDKLFLMTIHMQIF